MKLCEKCVKEKIATCIECLEFFDPKESNANDKDSFCSEWCEQYFLDQMECERVGFYKPKKTIL